jgi:hypothetical protein
VEGEDGEEQDAVSAIKERMGGVGCTGNGVSGAVLRGHFADYQNGFCLQQHFEERVSMSVFEPMHTVIFSFPKNGPRYPLV